MYSLHSLIAILIISTAADASAAQLECTNPNTDEISRTTLGAIKRSMRQLQRKMRKRDILFVDLPSAARRSRRRLEISLAEENWCNVFFDVQNIDDAVGMINIDSAFTSAKFTSLDHWLRDTSIDPATKTIAQRQVKKGTALMSKGNYAKANKALNRAVIAILGVKDGWTIPESLPGAEKLALKNVVIKESDVKKGCPNAGPQTPLEPTIKRLRQAMKERGIRIDDYTLGVALLNDLKHYRNMGATWPALRIVCVMIYKTKSIDIDIGLLSGRLMRLNRLRNQRKLNASKDEDFRVQIRAITSAMGMSDFVEAHALSEKLSISMGYPRKPKLKLR